MRRRHAVFVWGVLLVAFFVLSALPVAWASPTQTHGRFTVPTRTPTSSPPTEAPTQEPTDEPSPPQEPTDEPPDDPPPTEEPTAEPSPPDADATATPTPLSSTGTHTRTLPATPTGTLLPTVAPTLTASPTPNEGTPTSTVSPTPGEPTATLTSTVGSGETEPATDFEADAMDVLSETTETITATEAGVTETLTSSPVITSSQPSALAVTATPSESPSGGSGRNRISPLFLGGLAAIILGILVSFAGKRLVGKRLGGTSSSRDFVSEPNHAVPMDGLSRSARRQPIEAEASEALPSPPSEVYETDRDGTAEPSADVPSEDGGD